MTSEELAEQFVREYDRCESRGVSKRDYFARAVLMLLQLRAQPWQETHG